MKITPTATPTRTPKPSVLEPPLWIDDLGRARDIADAPSTDEAWVLLTGATPTHGELVARLVACRDRSEQAMHQTARGLAAIGERRRAGDPVPPSWVDRLADLVVEELEALWAMDDAAHRAALACPSWVGLPVGERPISPDEQSWPRVARLIAREVQLIAGLEVDDAAFDRLCGMDATREYAEGDAERARENARAAIRWAVRARHGGTCRDRRGGVSRGDRQDG